MAYKSSEAIPLYAKGDQLKRQKYQPGEYYNRTKREDLRCYRSDSWQRVLDTPNLRRLPLLPTPPFLNFVQ